MKRKTVTSVLVLVLTLLVGFHSVGSAAPIGNVEIEDCVDSDDVYGFICENRNVITVPVSYGLSAELDVMDVDGNVTEYTITKTPPVLYYPLTYLHTVPFYPYEEVIKVPHPITGCPGCIDCWDSLDPTCGWQLHDGTKIPDSQGFCVIKSLWELENSLWSCAFFRGEKLLGEQATLENPFSTGHAMRGGVIYFHGYEIREYSKFYEVEVDMKTTVERYQFILTPADPFHLTDPEETTFNVKAELLGDLAGNQGAAQLDNYILYIPAFPDSEIIVQQYQTNMLLVPREEVSKDGGEPDKVGVSFHKFRSLGSDYKVSEAGDGLHNQLFQKHNSDLPIDGNDTTYLVHGKKPFKDSMNFIPGMAKVLQQKITHIENSLVSLTLDEVDSLKVIENESRGIIGYATVEDFESMSRNGTVHVKIANVGVTPGNTDYVVTVTDSTMHILHAIPAQARTLAQRESAMLSFDIYTKYNMDTSNEGLVTLKSPTGRIYDKVIVPFDTEKHRSDYSWELQQKNEASKATLPSDTNAPVITLNGPDTMVLECGLDSYVELGAEAVDDIDGSVDVVIGGDTVDTSACGTYVVVYSSRDSSCNLAEVIRTVQVVDTTAPEFVLSVVPDVLWPPNHQMVMITPSWTVSDNCDQSPEVTLVSVVMNEGELTSTYDPTFDNNIDAGNTGDDIQIIDGVIYLRAERSGNGDGRIYTITYQAQDDSANTAYADAEVSVPHNLTP